MLTIHLLIGNVPWRRDWWLQSTVRVFGHKYIIVLGLHCCQAVQLPYQFTFRSPIKNFVFCSHWLYWVWLCVTVRKQIDMVNWIYEYPGSYDILCIFFSLYSLCIISLCPKNVQAAQTNRCMWQSLVCPQLLQCNITATTLCIFRLTTAWRRRKICCHEFYWYAL